jgi:hypothetical protein
MIHSFHRPLAAALVGACLLACSLAAHAERRKLLLTGGVAASTVPRAAASRPGP